MSDSFGPNSGNNWNSSVSGPFGQRPDPEGTRRVGATPGSTPSGSFNQRPDPEGTRRVGAMLGGTSSGSFNQRPDPEGTRRIGVPSEGSVPGSSPKSGNVASAGGSSSAQAKMDIFTLAGTGTALTGKPQSVPPNLPVSPAANGNRAKPTRSLPVMAALVVGILFLATVLVMIAIDRFSTPNVELPSTMPVAPEVQEWNNAVNEYTPTESHPTAIDPVSKEPVDPKRTPYKIDVYGTWFYFASEANLREFTEDPLKYLKVNVDVKLLDDNGQPIEGGSFGDVPSTSDVPAPGESGEDASSLYKQIPSPQGGEDSSASGAAGAEALEAPTDLPGSSSASSSSQVGDVVPGSAVQPVPSAGGAVYGEPSGAGEASLYQQIPAPGASEGQTDYSGGQPSQGGMDYPQGQAPAEGMYQGGASSQAPASVPDGAAPVPQQSGTYNGIPDYVPGEAANGNPVNGAPVTGGF